MFLEIYLAITSCVSKAHTLGSIALQHVDGILVFEYVGTSKEIEMRGALLKHLCQLLSKYN
jgi:hypothetical protein